MSAFELRFLGDFEVLRDGKPSKLPPSKKTRALLAFLSLNQRHFRRDYLCELLWEIPDDPRGSLRWSLSKLRGIVDDKKHTRIIADRTNVEFNADEVEIDASELLKLADGGLAGASTEDLQRAADRYQGNFLEGLEMSSFHDFHSWCVAERERVSRAQADLLRELVARFHDNPEAALPYTRRLVAISPYDEAARSDLIRLLITLRHLDEAEQQYRLGMRMLDEVGAGSSGAMAAALRGGPGKPVSVEPQPAAVVRPVARATSATIGSGIVGRGEELSQLAILFDEVAEQSRANCVLIAGDPGIGKSRLLGVVSELAEATGAFQMSAHAYESESLRPFAMWIDALRKRVPDTAASIFSDQARQKRDGLLDGLSSFVATETRDGPVVLIFDDVHWCDESSSAALHYVTRMNRERPLLIVIAGRGSEMRDNVQLQQSIRGLRKDGVLTEIDLHPLAQASAIELIRQYAPESDCERLSRECGGNPLLAIELARAEVEGGTGRSLDELVHERLARLDIDAAEILRWASVMSPHIDMDWLVDLTGQEPDRVGALLESAERQAMLKATDAGFRFSHDLIARGVYNGISPVRRQVMHRRVAKLLEKNTALDLSHAADLAHHAAQSGDTGLAARAMVSAGRLCLRFYANEEALTLAHKGMQLVSELADAERVCVSIDLHDIMFSAAPLDDWEAAAREYAALAEQAVDHGELSHARLGYHMAATVRWAHGQWSDAREQSLQSERVVRTARVEDQIVGMAHTARCLVMLERDLPQADAMLMEASALATREWVNYHAIPAGIGMLRFHENRFDEAEELLKDARTLCKADGDRVSEFMANEYLMMIEFERGQYKAARKCCNALALIGEKLREGSEGPFARAASGLCDYAVDDRPEELQQGLAELRVADAKHRLAYILTRAEDALAKGEEALEYATLLRRATEMALAHMVLASANRGLKNVDIAAAHEGSAAELMDTGVAEWAREYVSTRDNDSGATPE
jgi:DNA-binding SARP family transcriptional activator